MPGGRFWTDALGLLGVNNLETQKEAKQLGCSSRCWRHSSDQGNFLWSLTYCSIWTFSLGFNMTWRSPPIVKRFNKQYFSERNQRISNNYAMQQLSSKLFLKFGREREDEWEDETELEQFRKRGTVLLYCIVTLYGIAQKWLRKEVSGLAIRWTSMGKWNV